MSSHQTRNLLTALREETRSLHEETERVFPIMKPDLSLQGYRAIIELFRAMYVDFEGRIPKCPSDEVRSFAESHRRLPALETDLRFLVEGSVETTPLPPLPPSPKLDSETSWIGMLYVSEGSRLGGLYLARHLSEHFGFSGGLGYSFFAGSGRKTKEEWSAFCALCERIVEPSSINEVVDAAKDAFEWYLACFRELHF